MLRRRDQLGEVLELLQGIGRILMGISAKLDVIIATMRDEDEETDT